VNYPFKKIVLVPIDFHSVDAGRKCYGSQWELNILKMIFHRINKVIEVGNDIRGNK